MADQSNNSLKREHEPNTLSMPTHTDEENNQQNITPTQLFTINVIEDIHTMQMRNGLKYQDFQRYWKFCTKKIKKIRKKLNFKNGKRTYTKKPYPIPINDIRYLKLALLHAERAWGHANYLKSEQATASKMNTNLKYHVLRRFSKATSYSKELESLLKDWADKRSYLDAQAYHNKMCAILYTEKKEFKLAAEFLTHTYNNFNQLRRLSIGIPSQEKLYRQHLEELEPLIRLCEYHLGRKINLNMDATGPTIQPTSPMNMNDKEKTIIHRGHNISIFAIGNTELSNQMVECLENFENLRISKFELQKDGVEFLNRLKQNTVIEEYGEIRTKCEDILQSMRIHALASSNKTKKHFTQAQSLIMDTKNSASYERNILLLLLYINKFTPSAVPPSNINFDEGLRYIDLLNEDINKVSEIEENSEDQVIQTFYFQWAMEILQYCKSFCLSVLYYSLNNFNEALVLADYLKHIQQYTDITNQLEDMDHFFKPLFLLFMKLKTSLSEMAISLQYRCMSRAIQKYNELKFSEEYKSTMDIKAIKFSEELQFPPVPVPIPHKPILFDLAFDSYKPPNIDHRIKTTDSKGLFNRFKSFWN